MEPNTISENCSRELCAILDNIKKISTENAIKIKELHTKMAQIREQIPGMDLRVNDLGKEFVS